MRRTPVFLGLMRPTTFLGLPLGYGVALSLSTFVPLIGTGSLWWLLVPVIAYPPLWLVADRNPHVFDILQVVTARTPRTPGRTENGGDRYVG